jgi:hypothetical protein
MKNKQERFEDAVRGVLVHHGVSHIFHELMAAIKEAVRTPAPNTPAYRMLVKYIASKSHPSVAHDKAKRLYDKYGEKICLRALKDNACTSEFKLKEICEYLKSKK